MRMNRAFLRRAVRHATDDEPAVLRSSAILGLARIPLSPDRLESLSEQPDRVAACGGGGCTR